MMSRQLTCSTADLASAHAVLADGASSERAQLADVPFEIRATDISKARSATFSMPLLFVGKLAELTKSNGGAGSRTTQRPRFASAAPRRAGRSSPMRRRIRQTRAIRSFRRDAHIQGGRRSATPAKPNFYPEVDVAEVGIKPIQKLLVATELHRRGRISRVLQEHGFDAGKEHRTDVSQAHLREGADVRRRAAQAKSDSLGALATPQDEPARPVEGDGTGVGEGRRRRDRRSKAS